MKICRLEHRADAKSRCLELVVGFAEDRGMPTSGLRQAEQHSQCRRLSGAVGSKETRNGSRLNVERQVVDGENLAVAFAERITLNYVGHVLTFALGTLRV